MLISEIDYSQGDDESADEEALGVHAAADMWMSSGMNEDQMFGYSEDELRRALNG